MPKGSSENYTFSYGADSFAGYFDIGTRPTAATAKSIKAAAIDEVSEISRDPTPEEPLNDEACNSILEGLSMFKAQ